MKQLVKSGSKEKGATLVEYGLLVALIAVICIVAVKLLGTSISGQLSKVASEVSGST